VSSNAERVSLNVSSCLRVIERVERTVRLYDERGEREGCRGRISIARVEGCASRLSGRCAGGEQQ
jgi:hypothetical protein